MILRNYFCCFIGLFVTFSLQAQSVIDTSSVIWEQQTKVPASILDYATTQNIIFGATNFGLFTSNDNGANWSRHYNVPQRKIRSVRAGGNNVLAAFADSKVTYSLTSTQTAIEIGVYVSNDGGISFEPHVLTIDTTSGSSIANVGFYGLFQKNDSTYYLSYSIEQGVLFSQNLLWVTTDSGATWTLIVGKLFKDIAFVDDIAFGVQAENNLIFASQSATFNDVDSLTTPASASFFDLNSKLYRSAPSVLYVSNDAAQTWDTLQINPNVGTLVSAQLVGNTVFGLNTNGVLWGFGYPNFTDATLLSLPTVNMFTGVTAFLSIPASVQVSLTDGCNIRSLSGGASWQISSDGLEPGRQVKLYQTEGYLYATDVNTGQVLSRSGNAPWISLKDDQIKNGANFTKVGSNTFASREKLIFESANNGTTWTLSTLSTTSWKGIIAYSDTVIAWSSNLLSVHIANETWIETPTTFSINDIVMLSGNLFAISGNKVYRSINLAQTWEQVLTYTSNFSDILVDNQTLVVSNLDGSIQVSTDAGNNFQQTSPAFGTTTPPYYTAALLLKEGYLCSLRYYFDISNFSFDEGESKVYVSDNYGKTWILLSDLPEFMNFRRCSFHVIADSLIANGNFCQWATSWASIKALFDCQMQIGYQTTCNDNNTPNTPDDDLFNLTFQVSDGIGSQYQATINSIVISGNYTDSTTVPTPFDISNDTLTIYVSGGTAHCNTQLNIVSPEPCSVPLPDTANLSLLWIVSDTLAIGSTTLTQLQIANNGPNPLDSAAVHIILTDGLVYAGENVPELQVDGQNIIWTITGLSQSETYNIYFPVVRTQEQTQQLYAQVVYASLVDQNSIPDNGVAFQPNEDDEAVAFIAEIPDSIDLQLAWQSPDTIPTAQISILSLTITNSGEINCDSFKVAITLPNGLIYQPDTINSTMVGSGLNWIWSVSTWGQIGSLTLEIPVFRSTDSSLVMYAQVIEASNIDADATPNNGTCCTANEDDESAITLIQNQPPLQLCRIFAQVVQVICINSETPSPLDDLITLEVVVSGENAGDTYLACSLLSQQADSTICTEATGNFGETVFWGAFPAVNTAGFDINIYSEAFSDCVTSITVPEINCSPFINAPDIKLDITALNVMPASYTYIPTKIIAVNEGTVTATDVKISIPKPTGVVYSGSNSYTLTQGIYSTYYHRWTIPTLAAGDTAILTLNYFLLTANMVTVYAQVTNMTETDFDSQPNNGACCNSNEDDEVAFFFNYQTINTQPIDLALNMIAPTEVEDNTYLSATITLTNQGNQTAGLTKVKVTKPTGYVYQGSNEYSVSTGSFSPYSTSIWTVQSLAAGQNATLTLNFFALNDAPSVIYAQVIEATQLDNDSSPNNGICCSPNEDDEVNAPINANNGGRPLMRLNETEEIAQSESISSTKNDINTTVINKELTEIRVFDLTGRLVFQQIPTHINNTSELELQQLPTGVYLIHCYYNDGSTTTTKALNNGQ